MGFQLPQGSVHSPHARPILPPLSVMQQAPLKVDGLGGRQRTVPSLKVTPVLCGPKKHPTGVQGTLPGFQGG